MNFLKLLLVFILVTAVSCSNSRKTTTESEKSSKTDETEVVTETSEEEADFIVDGDDEELIVEDSSGDDELVVDDIVLEETEETTTTDTEELADIEITDEELATDEAISSSNIEISNEVGSYTVKSGETLMMIAFNIYGDYRKWREIRDMNGLSSTSLRAGMNLQYKKPSETFSWNPDGLPYLIRTGDTLGTISNDKYGTSSKWRLIFDNNRPLIKDPNLIFAGFTIYYIPEGDLASYTGAN